MKTRIDFTCPLEITHDIIKGKWKPIILWQLGKSIHSLSKLKNEIKGISEKMLLEQLKELQDFDLVGKNEFSGYPLKVEYYITDRGKKMLEAVKVMQEIGVEIMLENGMDEQLKEKGILYTRKSK